MGEKMRHFKSLSLIALMALQFACSSTEEKKFLTKETSTIVTKEIEYSIDNKTMKGFLAIPEGEGPFPGVLVVHEWWGQTEFPRAQARRLAQNGYAAFAVDMYGEGQTFDHPKDAKVFAQKVMGDMDSAEASFKAALITLKQQPSVDKNKTAALGYCFGGSIVLEMARRGTDINMVASYHGGLSPLVNEDIPKIKTRILMFNGGADTFVSKEDVLTARKKLKQAKVRYKFVNFKNAQHGFTNPSATEIGEKYNLPLSYNKTADESSWQQTLDAFKIVFKK